MKVINPATEKVIAERSEDTALTTAEKFRKAAAAQGAWAKVSIGERRKILARFSQLLVARKDELATLLSREMGKPIKQARNEIATTPDRIRFFVDNVERALADEEIVSEPGKIGELIRQEPLGVIANISAWNYPYFVGVNVFVPALLTGNAVLYKPSELATLTGEGIASLLWEAGVPREVFSVIVGGAAAGAALLEQPVNGVFFTGSVATGRKIAAAAAGLLVKVQLELGGKDPVYVCEDVDLMRAVASVADGAFYNTGQSCCAVERIYVHERIAPAFLSAFVEVVRGFTVGDPLDEKTYIGPLARAAQLGVLEDQIRDAVGKGAKILLGGKRVQNRRGYFFEPTVMANVTADMKVMREESFGPVIGIAAVKDDAEALSLMNDSEFGLTAGVYTADEARARRLLGGVEVGSAYWNCCDRVSPRLPWSGRKNSGVGLTLSFEGLRAFLQPKAYHLRRSL